MRTFPSFIRGEWHESQHLHAVHSPAAGEVVGAVHVASAAHVEEAIAAGKAARAEMAALPAHKRRALLDRIAGSLRAREAELVDLIAAEAGKPVQLARAEVQRAQDTFAFAADEAGRLGGDNVDLGAAGPGEGRWGVVRRFPIGLVAAITPFNFPLNLVAHKVAPALAAGCPIVVKPSPKAPLTAFTLAEICAEAGVPAGGLNVVMCSNDDADPLITDPRVHLLSFTGSAAVGWGLKNRAGHKKVVLELGGNAAAVVCADADLADALPRIARGGYGYAGQSCISVQHMLVHRSRLAEARAGLVAEIARLPCGDPTDPHVVCGPVIDAEAADRLEGWLVEAIQGGARVLVRGERRGNLLPPVLLEDVPHHARLCCQEAFGPVVCLSAFDALDEAIARVNDSRYGLQVGVFTDSVATIWRCFQQIEVGAVIHNDVPTFRVDQMPYGGVKASGVGREGPREAILDYTEPRLLALRPGRAR